MDKLIKPGQTIKFSGQYELLGKRNGRTGEEYTFVKGHIASPTPMSGMKFILVDKTK